jgi:nitroreductase
MVDIVHFTLVGYECRAKYYSCTVPEHATVDIILRRRSIRRGYSNAAIEPDVLEQIVNCGLAAPSSKNARPWRLHVVTSRPQMARLADAVSHAHGIDTYVPSDPATGLPRPQYQSTVLESAEVLRAVPATIWVENLGAFSGGRASLAAAHPDALAGCLEGYGFELVGIGTAVENMWIAANSVGVSAAFVGDVVIAEPEVRRELGLIGDLVGFLALGYSSTEATKPMDEPAFSDIDRVVWHEGDA